MRRLVRRESFWNFRESPIGLEGCPKRILTLVLGASVLALVASVEGYAADLNCSTPTSISTPTTYDNVTVQNGCVLTVDATLTVNNNMTIQSGGVVTHSDRSVIGTGAKLE